MPQSQKIECHAINTHSYFLRSGKTSELVTNIVPKNIFIFVLGSFGKYTKDPENENLGQKWTRGIDTECDGDTYNAPIHNWLKNWFTSPGELPAQKYGDVAVFAPGMSCPDRVLAPDKNAFVPGTQESKTMNYFTEASKESFSLLLTQIERSELNERKKGLITHMRETAKTAVSNGLRSDGNAVMHLRFTLSRLCNYISKQNPNKTILLLVLGCHVIPNEINLSIKPYSATNITNNYKIWINILKSIRIGREVISRLPHSKSVARVNIPPNIDPVYWGIVHPDDEDREEKGWHNEKIITRWKKEIVYVITGKREYTEKIYYDIIDDLQVSKIGERMMKLLVRKIIRVGDEADVLTS